MQPPGGPLGVGGETPVELEEDLLGNILGRRPIGKHPVSDGNDLWILLHEQSFERIRRPVINRAQGVVGGAAPGIELQHPDRMHRRGSKCDTVAPPDMPAQRSWTITAGTRSAHVSVM